MDCADVLFCRDYFASEKRDPTMTEIRMIDTYWSDHCRHTTFLTTIDSVRFEDKEVGDAYERYLAARREQGRTKDICLMDIATAALRSLKAQGKLPKLDESEEINACTVKFTAKTDGGDEDWLLLFKNETHNHPTEIERCGDLYRRRDPRSAFRTRVCLFRDARYGRGRPSPQRSRDDPRQAAAAQDRDDGGGRIQLIRKSDRTRHGSGP